MKKRSLEKWEKTRSKGFTRFMLLHGMLGWGLSMFLIMTFIVPWRNVDGPRAVFLSALVWLVAGLVWGLFTWLLMEWIYRRNRG